MNTPKIEILAEGDKLGEGPFWDAESQRLLWSDIYNSIIYAYDVATNQKSIYHQGHMTFGLVRHRDGALIVTGATGMHYLGGPGDIRPILTECEGESLFLNDVIADAKGRVYAGSVYWGAQGLVKRGKLYLVDQNGKPHIVYEGTGMSNGLGFSPDNQTLYYADSYDRVIWAFDVNAQSGELSNKRVFVTLRREEGMPDGLTVDAAGNVWCALWFGSCVRCYDPAGALRMTIPLPARQIASVMFGGRNLDELYITSSSVPFRDPALAPPHYDFDAPDSGGALYRVWPGVKGRLENLANMTPPPRQ